MSDPSKELPIELGRLHERYPHWRFGQLVSNVAAWAGGDRPGEVWEVSDEAMLTAAREHLAQADGAGGSPRRAVV